MVQGFRSAEEVQRFSDMMEEMCYIVATKHSGSLKVCPFWAHCRHPCAGARGLLFDTHVSCARPLYTPTRQSSNATQRLCSHWRPSCSTCVMTCLCVWVRTRACWGKGLCVCGGGRVRVYVRERELPLRLAAVVVARRARNVKNLRLLGWIISFCF